MGTLVRTALHLVSRRPLSCFFLAVLLLGSCSVPLRQPEAGTRIITGVPFFPQDDYQCGPASLAAVLSFLGVTTTPEEIAGEIYSESARGTLNMDLALAAERRSLVAKVYRGSIDDIRQKIDAGQPLIALVDKGFSLFQANHFMVIIGYGKDHIVVNSGRRERFVIPLGEFLRSWERSGFWTLHVRR